jgi:hypothetical protein
VLKKAPALLYLVIFLLVLVTLIHALGVTGIFRSWNWLRAFEVFPGTIYLVFKNVLLALGFSASTVAFIFRKHWAPGLAAAFTLLSAAWFWVDRTILNQSPLPFSRHIFTLVLTLMFVLILLLSYWSLEPYMKPPHVKFHPGGDLDEKE